MKDVKNLTIEMNDTFFSLSTSIEDMELILCLLGALKEFAQKEVTIKIRQTYMNLPTDSQQLISKVISKERQLDEWIAEMKQLITVIRKEI